MVMLSRFGALCVAMLFLGAGRSALRAQPAAEVLPAKPASPEDLSRDELLKSYLQLREQLHAAELAIVNDRIESEAAARAQAAAITERLDAIKADMAAERARQQLDAQRVAAERERQQAEAQRSYRTVLYVASAIGGLGLLAMLFTTLFQWRSISRIAEVTALRLQLPDQARLGFSPDENGAPSGEAVALSNQRLLSVIHRMERRISELEHTAVHPLPAAAVEPPGKSDSPRRTAAAATAAAATTVNDQAARITALLGKGWSLYSRNRAAEAMACYDEILKLDANHPEALVKKGAALEQLKQDHEALQCYDRAIKADPKITIAYLSKGRVCNRLERFDEALECYEQALSARAEGK
jgi:tetratricopeptide (TPR) repeat protein